MWLVREYAIRSTDRFVTWVAGRLPRRLLRAAVVRAGVETIRDDEVVPEVPYTTVLQRTYAGDTITGRAPAWSDR